MKTVPSHHTTYVGGNKKVLLREHKRHTARHVSSTCCAALSNLDLVGGEGTWSQVWGVPGSRFRGYPVPGLGGYPVLVQGGPPSQVWGVPHLRFRGYPISGLGGTPSHGVPPLSRPGIWYPTSQTCDGVPPYLDLRWGTPSPRSRCGLTHKVKILPSPSFGCGR